MHVRFRFDYAAGHAVLLYTAYTDGIAFRLRCIASSISEIFQWATLPTPVCYAVESSQRIYLEGMGFDEIQQTLLVIACHRCCYTRSRFKVVPCQIVKEIIRNLLHIGCGAIIFTSFVT